MEERVPDGRMAFQVDNGNDNYEEWHLLWPKDIRDVKTLVNLQSGTELQKIYGYNNDPPLELHMTRQELFRWINEAEAAGEK